MPPSSRSAGRTDRLRQVRDQDGDHERDADGLAGCEPDAEHQLLRMPVVAVPPPRRAGLRPPSPWPSRARASRMRVGDVVADRSAAATPITRGMGPARSSPSSQSSKAIEAISAPAPKPQHDAEPARRPGAQQREHRTERNSGAAATRPHRIAPPMSDLRAPYSPTSAGLRHPGVAEDGDVSRDGDGSSLPRCAWRAHEDVVQSE